MSSINLISPITPMMNTELKYKEITEKIIGASFEVHKFLGKGFQEVIYQRALAWEMKRLVLTQKQRNP